MTEQEMREDLKKNGIIDNPFDVILTESLAIANEALFAGRRMKEKNVKEMVSDSMEIMNDLMERINKEYEKLKKLSGESVLFCRDMASYHDEELFNELNHNLCKAEKELHTLRMSGNPNRNDEYEKVRLGEESEEYQRLVFLRELADSSDEFKNATENYLMSFMDIIELPKEDIMKDWEDIDDVEEYEYRLGVIQKYGLTIMDIEYMISWKFN